LKHVAKIIRAYATVNAEISNLLMRFVVESLAYSICKKCLVLVVLVLVLSLSIMRLFKLLKSRHLC